MPLIHVTSPADPRLDAFRDIRERDLRGRDRLFIAESERVLLRLLRTPERVHALFLSAPRHAALEPRLRELPAEVPIFIAELPVMAAVAGFFIHRGVLAAGRRPAPETQRVERVLGPLAGRDRATIVVAEGIVDVDNLGAIFRNAAALGADAIVLDPASCDPLYRKAIRVSMGHVLSMPWARCNDWPDDLVRLRSEHGFRLVAAETGAASQPAWRLPEAPRLAIVLGSEGHGLTAAAQAACDARVEIPMAASVPSLNVAVASAVLLYERLRSAAVADGAEDACSRPLEARRP